MANAVRYSSRKNKYSKNKPKSKKTKRSKSRSNSRSNSRSKSRSNSRSNSRSKSRSIKKGGGRVPTSYVGSIQGEFINDRGQQLFRNPVGGIA